MMNLRILLTPTRRRRGRYDWAPGLIFWVTYAVIAIVCARRDRNRETPYGH